jgi:hypothetical protein
MPSANVADLRAKLDLFARARLTPADFDPKLILDAELGLAEVTPELFDALRLLEPYGIGNPEPIFAARAVQLTAPPRIVKDKHVKLKLRAGAMSNDIVAGELEKLSAVAVLATPGCHPDGAALRRDQKAAALAEGYASAVPPRTENRELRTANPELKSKITFDALGWHMAERLRQTPLLAGDAIDVAFSIRNNDHPEYGGLELCLRDFDIPVR